LSGISQAVRHFFRRGDSSAYAAIVGNFLQKIIGRIGEPKKTIHNRKGPGKRVRKINAIRIVDALINVHGTIRVRRAGRAKLKRSRTVVYRPARKAQKILAAFHSLMLVVRFDPKVRPHGCAEPILNKHSSVYEKEGQGMRVAAKHLQ
jgi:hypothetical protein